MAIDKIENIKVILFVLCIFIYKAIYFFKEKYVYIFFNNI